MASKVSKFLPVVVALSLAQFIMTIDTTIMNVSIPTLVNDLDTTVDLVQLAITLYALVMASFMLLGGKLGELYGRLKIFRIGLVIYGIGSAITAIAPSIGVLIFGWSILEGIGASMMMPAMMSLISINFSGKKRVSALAIVAGVAGAAAALGPIVGGALSTYATWRYAFVGEVVIALIALVMSKNIMDSKQLSKEKLDLKGATMAALGLCVAVLGVMQASTYGWILAKQPLVIGSFEIAPFGLSIVPIICGFGFFVLWLFYRNQMSNIKLRVPTLVDVRLLSKISLRSGLVVVMVTQLVLGGTLFIMPLFLQLVLGYSAMDTGIAMLPMSVAIVAISLCSNWFAKRYSAIKSVRMGQSILFLSLVVLFINVSSDTTNSDLFLPFALMGVGIGLILPFIQSILLGSAKDSESSQVAGLNYTAQQLGMSLGTAVIGTILLFSLGKGFVTGLSSTDSFDQQKIEQNSIQISNEVEFASNEQLSTALDSSDLNQEQKQDVITINEDARLRALRASVAAAAVIALIGLISSGKIKDFKLPKG